MSPQRASPLTRLALGAMLLGLGGTLTMTSPAAQLVSIAGLCFWVVLAGSWELDPLIQKQLERNVFPRIPDHEAKALGTATTIRGNLRVVVDEGERLTALINDLLDLSKMESGQMVWDLSTESVDALVARALDATEGLLGEESPVRTVIDVEPDLPLVRVDRDRAQQVLINLISNAAKFTDEGEITVSARRVDGSVEIAVRDTGAGLRPGHLEVIFEKFKQVGEVLTDRLKGTGLGLPICREIVTQLGGDIWVESELGVGSRFAFTLPLADPTDEARA